MGSSHFGCHFLRGRQLYQNSISSPEQVNPFKGGYSCKKEFAESKFFLSIEAPSQGKQIHVLLDHSELISVIFTKENNWALLFKASLA